MPSSRYFCHRLTILSRCVTDSDSEDPSISKKAGADRREAKVAEKSGGVTSETNHGISFGLRQVRVGEKEWGGGGNILEYDVLHKGRKGD